MSSEGLAKESSIPSPLSCALAEEGRSEGGQSSSPQQPAQVADDVAIRVQNLSKCYHIYDKPHDRLKQAIYPRLRRLMGMEPKNYAREFWALKDVSFEIKKGETVGIIGRNGSGKSTLLQLICGTLSATSGTIETQGRIAALLELGSGFNPEFTGRENVYINASILGLSQAEIDAKFDEIVAFAEIGDFIDQPVKTYSSGMFVRLAFAVIVHVDADILVIDEALAVGDVFFRQKCMRFLNNFKMNGTIIFVTHDSCTVVSLCDRAIWLERGEAQLIGEAKHVCEAYLARRYDAACFNAQKQITETPSLSLGRNALSKHDARMDFINHSNLRNDIEVFSFSSETRGFGSGGGTITNARLTDLAGRQLSWVVGGEMVRIEIEALVNVACSNIIIGFQLKNGLGQAVFDQNSYMAYCLNPFAANPNEVVKGIFTFRLPILPPGSYTVDVAIADGIPPSVIQLQWLHDAFSLESHTSSVVSGLVGLVCDSIELYGQTKESTNVQREQCQGI
ncbi:MAG: ABC transporter ATP-binding protein [Nitrospira sp.]|nr:ABC transporter ATP-binding protein [Nitrospira sp.]